jgi:uncharacterized cupredoxin-like copper-binding protein
MTSEYRTFALVITTGFAVAIALAIVGLVNPGLLGAGANATTAPTATSAHVAAPATAAPALTAVVTATVATPASPTAGPAPTESEAEQTIAVSLTEWKITGPAGVALGPLKAGEIKFDVHDDGTTQHEFVVIKSDADPASLAIADGKVDEAAAGESPGEADDIDPGQAKIATMRLEPGKYVFICNVVGHYLSGMHGQLIVE